MRIKKSLISLFILTGIILFIRNGLTQDDIPDKEMKNLIRKDLLFKGEEELDLPIRNIFSPVTSRRAQIGTAVVEEERNDIPEEEPPEKIEEKKEPARPSLNVRYIGYVRSDEKIVALILFRGQAFAVEKGELLEEKIEVKEVTVEEVALILGGFKPFKFAIEGETR